MAMSPTPLRERQLCLFNEAHKSIKNILFFRSSLFPGKDVSRCVAEVRLRPGQGASLAPPYSYLRFFGNKCTVLNKVLVTLLGLFSASRSDSAPLR